MMPRTACDCIVVAYAYRDGNTRELYYAFTYEAAEAAYDEAFNDERFGCARGSGASVVYAILGEG